MTTSTGTEGNPQGAPSNADLVPAAESHGDGGKPPGDWVPKTQFIAALNSATAKNDDLQRQLNELKNVVQAKAAAPERKPPTRAELNSLVGSGELTQEQADTLWEKQIVERAKHEAAAEVGRTAGAHELQRKVNTELSGYKELVPEVWQPGTPERERVEKEFKYLVDLGEPGAADDPRTKVTEAKALRAAFGDLQTLRASKSARPGPADTHAETGGGNPAGNGKGSDALKLDARQKAHYGKLIQQGIYGGWADVKAELEAAPRRAPRR